jgi:hypothetical protein
VAGCATGGRRVAFLDAPRRFARVRVAPERILRGHTALFGRMG